MIELKPWATTAASFLLLICFHFAGWALAAPVHDTKCGKQVVHWKFLVGVIGLFATIAALVIVGITGAA